jgi:hypothetical protein
VKLNVLIVELYERIIHSLYGFSTHNAALICLAIVGVWPLFRVSISLYACFYVRRVQCRLEGVKPIQIPRPGGREGGPGTDCCIWLCSSVVPLSVDCTN